MENRFKFEYKNGKLVEREVQLSDAKARQLAGKPKSFLDQLITTILSGKFVGKYASFSNFTVHDLAGIVALCSAAPAVTRADDVKPFTLHQETNRYSNKVVKTDVMPNSEVDSDTTKAYRYAMEVNGNKLPGTIDEMIRLTLCAIRFSKSGPDNAVKVSTVQPPPTAVKGFVPDLKPLGEELISTFGDSLCGEDESRKVVKSVLESSKPYERNLTSLQDKLVPSQIKIKRDRGRQVLIRNDALRINAQKYGGRQARSMVTNLMQVPISDKAGLGLYAQSHYDGYPARGVVRKYMEVLQDFDYTKKLSIVRLVTSDQNVARALYNAIRKSRKSEVLIVYDGNDSSKLSRHWDGDQVIRSGILAYPGNMFESAFRGHLKEVYYYSTAKPSVMTNHTPEALHDSNQKLIGVTTFLERYGYYSIYATMSALITEDEFATLRKIRDDLVTPKYSGFASSCKVRNGWLRVTSDGEMGAKEAIVHVANGRLHYLTWLYRANPFGAEGDNDGHTVGYAPLYDWVTGRETHAVDPRVLQELEGSTDPEVQKALRRLMGDEENEEVPPTFTATFVPEKVEVDPVVHAFQVTARYDDNAGRHSESEEREERDEEETDNEDPFGGLCQED